MKRIKLYLLLLLVTFATVSCDSYLAVDLQDQMTMDEVFDKRNTTEAYLAQVYGYLPNEYDILGTEGTVPCCDEASFSWLSWVQYVPQNNGSWGPTTSAYHNWGHNYRGISQATIFMNNVDRCVEITPEVKTQMKAEARFLRAYFYFVMVRKYGPVYIWGDKEADIAIRAEDVDRHSLDFCISFITEEYDKAVNDLPEEITDPAWNGRITKGIALAAKSRLQLYAARPLFNGCDLYKGIKNKNGEFLFPQTPDPSKWTAAANAAKAVIDMGKYTLYEDTETTDPLAKGIKSYMGVIFEKWNKEIIWGRWENAGFEWNVRSAPPRVVKEGYGGFAPSLKLVDTYPMAASGRYPVTGYQANGAPVIDPKSGYNDEGFTNPYYHPIDNYAPINAHNSCVGRDARFYASVLANGMYWINTTKGQKLVTFYKGGTSSYDDSKDCVKVGYLWRRMSDPRNNIEDGKWGTFCWPYYRLAEIYLNYAEACNEMPARNESEALLYINKVRNRSGLNNLEVAYPEVKGNKTLLRELLRKERMVELAFENLRFYDIRTWMIAEQESNGTRYARNLLSENYEASWNRTDKIYKEPIVFLPKHYLFPIHQDQLNEMKNITQNYGW